MTSSKFNVLARVDRFLAGGADSVPIDDQELESFRQLILDLAKLRFGTSDDGGDLLSLDVWDTARFDVVKAVPIPKAPTVSGALLMASAMGESLAALFGQLKRLDAQEIGSVVEELPGSAVAPAAERPMLSLDEAGNALFAAFETKNRYQPVHKAEDKDAWANEVLALSKKTAGVDAELRYVNTSPQGVAIGIRLPFYAETMTIDLHQ